MTLSDQQVRDIIEALCAQANIRREWIPLKLRERAAGAASLPALAAIADRYLAIVMHPEWLEASEEIMAQPKFAKRAAEGLKYQGCCCGHKHLLLTDTDAQMLRDAGFLVENDTETI
jgi:hypothetical protein